MPTNDQARMLKCVTKYLPMPASAFHQCPDDEDYLTYLNSEIEVYIADFETQINLKRDEDMVCILTYTNVTHRLCIQNYELLEDTERALLQKCAQIFPAFDPYVTIAIEYAQYYVALDQFQRSSRYHFTEGDMMDPLAGVQLFPNGTWKLCRFSPPWTTITLRIDTPQRMYEQLGMFEALENTGMVPMLKGEVA